jgi:23S rRNA (adenine2503-C2)-methyltransferase
MIDLKDYTLSELTGALKNLGLEPYRARQVFGWVHQKQVSTFDDMTSLPKAVRARLSREYTISNFTPCRIAESRDGSRKYVFETRDGHGIESVAIPERGYLTVCVSTQIGCAMGCGFCFTGQGGLVRDLRAGEIVNQVLAVLRQENPGNRLPNIVFMGMGEPLANYENLVKSIRILQDPNALHYSHRKITVSTCGLAPRITELGRDTDVNLAVSLNAPDDELRSSLMPVNRTYPLARLLQAAREYPLPPRKKITFEYILMKGINDTPRHAAMLAELLRGLRCKINLIPFNEHDHVEFRTPNEKQLLLFQKILHDHGYTAPVRRSKGTDIAAACGQLGRRAMEPPEPV